MPNISKIKINDILYNIKDNNIFVQAEEPVDTSEGALWVDLDEEAEAEKSIVVDDTLTQSGQAADAKVVGDKFSGINSSITSINTSLAGKQPRGNYVKTVNGTEPDNSGNIEISVSAEDSASIIDVLELPTENINEEAFYRIPKGTFVSNQGVVESTCYIVAGLPETGEPVTTNGRSINAGYYNTLDSEVYGYLPDAVASSAGVSAGWYTFSNIASMFGVTWIGVVGNILETPIDNSIGLLMEGDLWYHKYGWRMATSIGWYGEGIMAEVFNHPGNEATGMYAHAQGRGTVAKGSHSSAEGYYTIATCASQHVQGLYNIEDIHAKYAHIVGNGSSDTERANIHTLDWNGVGWFQGGLQVGGTAQDGEGVGYVPAIQTAKVGQVIAVKTVDENGKPTEWEAISIPVAKEDTTNSGCYYYETTNGVEWINPPMLLDIEYRTTEKWQGKAVYRKMVKYTSSVDIGDTNIYTEIDVPHNITGLTSLVQCHVTANNWGQIPFVAQSGGVTAVVSVDATNVKLRIVNDTWITPTFYIDISYIKE